MTSLIMRLKDPSGRLEGPTENTLSLTRHAFVGLAVMALLLFGLGGWSATTRIAGAVVSSGVVVVDGGSRRVQHAEGGIVREILVRDDQRVEAGQLLVRLDDVSIRAQLEVVLSQLRDAIGAQSRLTAESIGAPLMLLPSMISGWPSDPELAAILGDQERLRQSRKASLESQAARLREQISEKQASVEGLKSQQEATASQLALMDGEVANLESLFAKGLVPVQRLNEMKRSQAELTGQGGSVRAAIAAARSSVADLEMQVTQSTIDFRSGVLKELQAVSQSVAELLQKKIAAEDRLARLEIRASIAGTIHQSIVQTVGGVITPGDTLMLIVPEEEHLLIDARVSPLDIDKLQVGQEAEVRLSSFDARTTPQLAGTIVSMSPDFLRDAASGAQYYAVRVDVSDNERAKLPEGTRLVPGMPVEAFFHTGDRTVWSYLMTPIDQQLSHAFRE